MKTSELEGKLLDYWVARAEGFEWAKDVDPQLARGAPAYSTDWACGGPIIECQMDYVRKNHNDSRPQYAWVASQIGSGGLEHRGASPLIAAMRAYVASKFGDAVPDEAQS